MDWHEVNGALLVQERGYKYINTSGCSDSGESTEDESTNKRSEGNRSTSSGTTTRTVTISATGRRGTRAAGSTFGSALEGVKGFVGGGVDCEDHA